MILRIKRGEIKLAIYFISLILYIVLDYNLGMNSGIKAADRTPVYYLIVINIISQMLITIPFFNKYKVLKSPFTIRIALIIVLVFLSSLLTDTLSWGYVTRLGLNIWWISTLLYTYCIFIEYQSIIKQVIIGFTGIFIVYLAINIMAHNQIVTMYNKESVVLNYGYYVVVCAPFLFLLDNKKMRNILLILGLVIVVYSMKRGAIIAYLAMIIAGFEIDSLISSTVGKKWILLIAIVAVGVFFVLNRITEGALLERFSEENIEDGSGRKEMFSAAVESIRNRDFGKILIGLGSYSSIELVGLIIHNDYLEILSSYGIFTLVVFVSILIKMFEYTRSLYNNKSKYTASAAMILIYTSLVSLYGTTFFAHSFYPIAAMMGLIEAEAIGY